MDISQEAIWLCWYLVVVSSGSELDDETNQDGKSPMKILTAGDILGLFEESFQKFCYMHRQPKLTLREKGVM